MQTGLDAKILYVKGDLRGVTVVLKEVWNMMG
jgi:hypothetical protein